MFSHTCTSNFRVCDGQVIDVSNGLQGGGQSDSNFIGRGGKHSFGAEQKEELWNFSSPPSACHSTVTPCSGVSTADTISNRGIHINASTTISANPRHEQVRGRQRTPPPSGGRARIN